MPDPDPTIVSELVADMRARLLETSKRPAPAAPPKKLLEALDASVRDDVLGAAKELRAEHDVQKAVARSHAKQARALEKTMVADLARLADVARRIGAN